MHGVRRIQRRPAGGEHVSAPDPFATPSCVSEQANTHRPRMTNGPGSLRGRLGFHGGAGATPHAPASHCVLAQMGSLMQREPCRFPPHLPPAGTLGLRGLLAHRVALGKAKLHRPRPAAPKRHRQLPRGLALDVAALGGDDVRRAVDAEGDRVVGRGGRNPTIKATTPPPPHCRNTHLACSLCWP